MSDFNFKNLTTHSSGIWTSCWKPRFIETKSNTVLIGIFRTRYDREPPKRQWIRHGVEFLWQQEVSVIRYGTAVLDRQTKTWKTFTNCFLAAPKSLFKSRSHFEKLCIQRVLKNSLNIKDYKTLNPNDKQIHQGFASV